MHFPLFFGFPYVLPHFLKISAHNRVSCSDRLSNWDWCCLHFFTRVVLGNQRSPGSPGEGGGMPTIWYRHCHQGTSVLSRTGTGTPVGSQLTSTPYLLNPFNVFPLLKAVHSHHGCASCRALPTAWYSG